MRMLVGIGVPSKYFTFPVRASDSDAAVTLKRASREMPQATNMHSTTASQPPVMPSAKASAAGATPRPRQPGQGGPTYIYAHARTGMFLPLLTRSRISNGAAMIGMTVHVYTGDGVLFTYRIDRVYRHTTSLDGVTARHGERLWLQTSEGPHGTIPKLQVTARYVSRSSASYAASHPLPRPVRCG